MLGTDWACFILLPVAKVHLSVDLICGCPLRLCTDRASALDMLGKDCTPRPAGRTSALLQLRQGTSGGYR